VLLLSSSVSASSQDSHSLPPLPPHPTIVMLSVCVCLCLSVSVCVCLCLSVRASEWMTPDLFAKLASNPKLMRALNDPRMNPLLEEMQTNPKSAAAKLQADPEMAELFREFCNLMGSHLMTLPEQPQADAPQPKK
jgi:hypothetical protein